MTAVTKRQASGRALRLVALGVALVVLGVGGFGFAATSETVAVSVFKRRPRLLHFGKASRVGHCLVKETDDPSSDVLANLLDLDADGKSDYRLMGYIDGSTPSCERRVFGFFREVATRVRGRRSRAGGRETGSGASQGRAGSHERARTPLSHGSGFGTVSRFPRGSESAS